MGNAKSKYIADAVRVIDRRVELLEAELSKLEPKQSPRSNACDRSAISEAKHLARLIRSLDLGPYRGDAYKVAYDHWNHGRTTT